MSKTHPVPASDPAEVKSAGLRFVSDQKPGLRREPDGDGFRYFHPDGSPVEDEETLARIRSLAIPPAYTDVWICPQASGYLQATGRDAKGRKQSRYHPRWRETREETKYEHVLAFGDALPKLRATVDRDLARHGLPRPKVLATVVRLLETTLIRVGNEQYARENGHYGLTTMRREHVDVSGTTMRFHFVGKSGKEHTIDVRDRRLARTVQRLRDLPGEEIFEYTDEDNQRRQIHSEDVNEYLHAVMGAEFTAKDFRTWAGTVLASLALQEMDTFDTKAQARKNVTQAIKTVASRLGNTPAICRKCYIHPAVLASYLDGTLREALAQPLTQPSAQERADALNALRPEEAAVLALLRSGANEEKAC